MIQESLRELSDEERAELRGAMRPLPTIPLIEWEAWWPVLVGFGTLAVIALSGGSRGGLAVAGVAALIVASYHLGTTAARNARLRKNRGFAAEYLARRHEALNRILEDGRVAVKRVRAVAVVVLEPMEDEGFGYLYDLGDGRVLFLKGQDYPVPDDDEPWPNTDFEIARAVLDGTFIDLRLHGGPLPPLRVIRGDDCDPEVAWQEREEVLAMSLDEAVRMVL